MTATVGNPEFFVERLLSLDESEGEPDVWQRFTGISDKGHSSYDKALAHIERMKKYIPEYQENEFRIRQVVHVETVIYSTQDDE